jgi:hypothetical protein
MTDPAKSREKGKLPELFEIGTRTSLARARESRWLAYSIRRTEVRMKALEPIGRLAGLLNQEKGKQPRAITQNLNAVIATDPEIVSGIIKAARERRGLEVRREKAVSVRPRTPATSRQSVHECPLDATMLSVMLAASLRRLPRDSGRQPRTAFPHRHRLLKHPFLTGPLALTVVCFPQLVAGFVQSVAESARPTPWFPCFFCSSLSNIEVGIKSLFDAIPCGLCTTALLD